MVGTSTHFTGARDQADDRGVRARATSPRRSALHRRLLPLFTGIFRTQGTILVKAGLTLLGLPAGPVRPPLVDATDDELAQLRADCAAAGLDRLRDRWTPVRRRSERMTEAHIERRTRRRRCPRAACGSSRSAGSARSAAT